MKKRIYLDNNATTGMDPSVLEAMLPELSSTPYNPSSLHFFGQKAKAKLNESRELIAHFLKVKTQEIIFTSGGTESMNFLIRGFLEKKRNTHVLTSNVEHSCVFKTLKTLSNSTIEVEYLPAGLYGAVKPDQIQAALKPTTQLIVLSAVNSETGIKHDIEAIAKIALDANVAFIVDGVALLGKESFSIPPGVSGIGFSGHKFHGPKGVGFVFLRSSYTIPPLLIGGEQEFKLRAGTENLPGIIGLAKAIELLNTALPKATHHMATLRDKFEADLLQKANPVIVNGMGPRICNTCNLSFPRVHGEDLLIALDMAGIAASHGSACASGAMEPSRILTEMNVPFEIARSAIRFSFSRYTTLEEIDYATQVVSTSVANLRQLS